jgi:hypothetical protein
LIRESLSKIQPYPVYVPGAMLETLELSETVNSADLVIFNILYLGLSDYRPPIEVNPIGVVQEFHQLHSVQNSAVFVLYPRRYLRISGAFRICPHC